MSDTKHHRPASGSGRDEWIQVPKSQIRGLTQEYDRVSAKCKRQENQLKAFTNFSEIINKQKDELKVHKAKSQQFESAYIASEAKLGHILKTWINFSQKSGGLSEVEVIENMLQLKTDDLFSKQFPNSWSIQDKKSKDITVRPVKNDLETGCQPDLQNDCETDFGPKVQNDLEKDCGPKVKNDFEADCEPDLQNDLETDSSPKKQNDFETDSGAKVQNDIEEDCDSEMDHAPVRKVGNRLSDCKKNMHYTGELAMGHFDTTEPIKAANVSLSKDTLADKVSFIGRGHIVQKAANSQDHENEEKLIDNNNSNLSSNINSQKTGKKAKRQQLTMENNKPNTIDHKGTSISNLSDMPSFNRQMSGYSKEIIEKLVEDKRQLRKEISEYVKESPEGWSAFVAHKQYEDLVKNLRLEVASVRIQNSELKMLLVAKQGGNIDALTKKINELDKQLSKLNKQLTAKHALLHSINTEYEKVKTSKQTPQISKVNDVEESATSDLNNTDEWKMKYDDLNTQFRDFIDNNEKGRIEMKNIIERLRSEKEKIELQCKEYASIIEEMKKTRISVEDVGESNLSMVHIREENEKLKADIETYRHELDAKKRDEAIVEAQICLYRDDYQKEIDSHKLDRQEHEKEKSQLLNLVKSMEIKFNKCLEDLNSLNQVHNICKDTETRLQSQFNTVYTQLKQEQAKSEQLTSALKLFKPPQPQPTLGQRSRCFDPQFPVAAIQYACDIVTDGTEEDPSEGPIYRNDQQSKHFHSSQSAPGGLNTPPMQRIVLGSSAHSSVKEEPSVSASNKLICPQCYREFQRGEDQKYNDHVAKCMI